MKYSAQNFSKNLLKQKQPSTGIPWKRCFENMQQIYNFVEIALRHGCSPVNLLDIFRTPFPKNTSGWLLLLKVGFQA